MGWQLCALPGAALHFACLQATKGPGVHWLRRVISAWVAVGTLLWAFASPCAAQPDVVMLPTEQDLFELGVVYRAKNEAVPSRETISEFKKNVLRVSKVGLTGGRYWLNVRVQISSNSQQLRIPQEWTFGRLGSYIETVELYVFDEVGEQYKRSGQFYPHDYPLHYGADFFMSPGRTYDLWVLYESRYFTGIPTAHLLPKQEYAYEVLVDNLLIIGCLGSIIILALYNLLLSVWTRSRDYLYYSLYLVSTFIGWAAVFKVFSQTMGITHVGLIIVPFYLNIILNIFFYRHFLAIDEKYSMLYRYGNAVAIVAFLLACAFPLLPLWTSYLLINLMTLFWLSGGLISGIIRLRDGYKPARFYIAGFTCMVIGGALVVLPFLGLPRLTQKEYLITLVAQTLDVLLLAIALADRINIMRQEKAMALQYAREVDQKATQVLLEANQKLSHALNVSEENQRQKDQFIMAVSHELRTPLNAISASLGQLVDAKEEQEKTLLHHYIQFGTDRLSSQVENLIMLAETDQKKIQPHQRCFPLASVLQRIQRLAEGYLFNKPVTFSIVRTGEDCTHCRGDDYLLIRLLTPVLENACKFTEKGSVRISVDVGQNSVTFCFEDTGVGIDPAMQARLFESFTQASTGYQREYGGLGIGLTVSQRLARLLGATLEINSQHGSGTRFSLTVPLQAENVEPGGLNVSMGRHALVVEDNEINARVLNALLKKLGFSTELAENGALALDRVKDTSFDIVLMDLQMPVMDGFASAAAMRKLGVHCPIVAVTANSDYEARIKCFDVGMNDLLTKPLNKDLLQEKLAYWTQTA